MSKRDDVLRVATQIFANVRGRSIKNSVEMAVMLVEAVDAWAEKQPKPTLPRPLPTLIPGGGR